jgi:hypothetical protein
MTKFQKIAVVFLALALSATAAFGASVVVNFDNLNNGDVITNQYAGVTFSSTSGNVNYVTAQSQYQSTPPNFLCSGPASGGIDCAQETFLNFSSPVNGLNFDGMGVNDIGVEAQIDVWTNGVFNSTVQVIGNAQGLAPDHIDLSGFSNVTEIRIYNIVDGGGIGWDTFQYTQGQGTTPEPGTLIMFGSGIIGLAGMLRRKINL